MNLFYLVWSRTSEKRIENVTCSLGEIIESFFFFFFNFLHHYFVVAELPFFLCYSVPDSLNAKHLSYRCRLL